MYFNSDFSALESPTEDLPKRQLPTIGEGSGFRVGPLSVPYIIRHPLLGTLMQRGSSIRIWSVSQKEWSHFWVPQVRGLP